MHRHPRHARTSGEVRHRLLADGHQLAGAVPHPRPGMAVTIAAIDNIGFVIGEFAFSQWRLRVHEFNGPGE